MYLFDVFVFFFSLCLVITILIVSYWNRPMFQRFMHESDTGNVEKNQHCHFGVIVPSLQPDDLLSG
jgi:hypothetical protein